MKNTSIALLLVFLFAAASLASAGSKVTVSRDLPAYAAPGSSFTVSLVMDVNESDPPAVVGLTEYYPAAWEVSNITFGGADRGGSMEWLFWALGTSVEDRTITYSVSVPESASGSYAFSGTVDTGDLESTAGDTSVTISTPTVEVSRDLPDQVYEKIRYTVYISVDVDESNKPTSIGVAEYYPSGWNISSISAGGIDFGDRIEWLISPLTVPVADMNLSYSFRAPEGTGSYGFDGTVYYTGYNGSVAGESTVTVLAGCSLEGDVPPCETVEVSEIVSFITEWASGGASLSDVIALINVWAA